MSVKIGLLGVGHLGKIHLNCIQQVPDLQLIGIYDLNQETADQVAAEFSVKAFRDPDMLISEVDALDIVTPTPTHHQWACKAIESGKHIFIEKPVTSTLSEAEELVELNKVPNLCIQVGHVERFNPAMMAIAHIPLHPKFIEVHRLATFNPRGTDVSVILDLMIHDLDIILSMVEGPIKNVYANGVNIVSDYPDIGNARIEWENGCVANVTASRISLKNMRKMRLFQSNAYIGLDFLERKAQVIRMFEQRQQLSDPDQGLELETSKGTRYIDVTLPDVQPVNAIREELAHFATCIKNGSRPEVGLQEAVAALSLAVRIDNQIRDNESQAIDA